MADLAGIHALLAQRTALLEQLQGAADPGAAAALVEGSAYLRSAQAHLGGGGGGGAERGRHGVASVAVQTAASDAANLLLAGVAAGSARAVTAAVAGGAPHTVGDAAQQQYKPAAAGGAAPASASGRPGYGANGVTLTFSLGLGGSPTSTAGPAAAPPVSCLEWCADAGAADGPLVLTGYGAPPAAALAGGGSSIPTTASGYACLALWAPASPAAPVATLLAGACAQAAGALREGGVTAVAFVPGTAARVVVAGTAGGSLLAWDTTRPAPASVAVSAPSPACHAFPIVRLAFVAPLADDGMADVDAGAQNSQPLILTSVSSDGRVCEWDLRGAATAGGRFAPGLLRAPLRSFALTKQQDRQAVGVRPSCVALPPSAAAASQLWAVGEEDGGVCWGDVGGAAAVAGAAVALSAWGGGVHPPHAAMVTAADAHPSTGDDDGGGGGSSSGFSASSPFELLLTSSFEGSVRLWSTRAGRLAPLLTLGVDSGAAAGAAGNHVADVAWCPVHPAVFATVDTGASVRLWHLGRDDRAPVVTRPVAPAGGGGGAKSSTTAAAAAGFGLTRLRWAPDGRRVVVGDVAGMVHVVAVPDELLAGGAGADEAEALRTRIAEWADLADGGAG